MDIYRLATELNVPERKIIDFSSPVNPLGVSAKAKAEVRRYLKFLHRHPDTEALRLRKRLAQYHNLAPETILCGNGSTDLLALIAAVIAPRRVLIPVPTRGEYELICRKSGQTAVIHFPLARENDFVLDVGGFIRRMAELSKGERSALSSAEGGVHNGDVMTGVDLFGDRNCLAFLCNPNYPTGRLLEKSALDTIADAAMDLGCYLVVDEAFLDFVQGAPSLAGMVTRNPRLIVLRSMSYFFSLAGLRVGYGIFPVEICERLRGQRVPWTVNSLAQQAAAVVLKDKAYRKRTMTLVAEEKRFLERGFRRLGIDFCRSDAHFYLLRTERAAEISRELMRRGMLVPECTGVPGLDGSYLCIAVKSHRENALLLKEMERVLSVRG